MAYSLTLSNGNYVPGVGPTGLPDGTIDAESTSLSLVGKNYPGYGKLLNENFLYLLENFASTKSPTAALPGQLWWDSNLDVLKVNTANNAGDAAIWKSLASVYTAAPITDATVGTVGTPSNIPYNPNIGDLWWDTANRQLKLYTAVLTLGTSGWLTIGPVNTAATGQTGATPDTILDIYGISHIVIKFYINNQLIGILNGGAAFTTVLLEFPQVYPGFNLCSSSTSLDYQYNGIATTALSLKMANNTVVAADKFARTDIVTASNVGLSTLSNAGVSIGSVGNMVVDLDPATGGGRIYHTLVNKNITIYVNNTGVRTPVFVANGMSGSAEVVNAPTTANGITNKFYVDAAANTAVATSNTYSNAVSANTLILSKTYTDTISANTLSSSKTYTNAAIITALVTSNAYADSTNITTLASSKTYTNTAISSAATASNAYADTVGNSSVAASKVYADTVSTATLNASKTYTNTAIATAATASNTYAVTAANTVANTAIAASKTYTNTAAILRDGTTTLTGSLVPSGNSTVNLGSTTAWFATVYGVSMQAKFADLAERFASDKEYAPGTVVELGGSAEITAVKDDLSNNVFGVISTGAAYLMNAGSGDNRTHPPVALSGRVPVNVIGKILKGDRLVSAGAGMARAAINTEITPRTVIGRALHDKLTDGTGTVEAIVRFSI